MPGDEAQQPVELSFQPAQDQELSQLSSQTSGQGGRILYSSIQRCGGWPDMGQWVVSVLGLEPLHLRVTLA